MYVSHRSSDQCAFSRWTGLFFLFFFSRCDNLELLLEVAVLLVEVAMLVEVAVLVVDSLSSPSAPPIFCGKAYFYYDL